VLTEDTAGGGKGNSDSTGVEGAGLDQPTEQDDTQETEPGGEQQGADTRQANGTLWDRVTTRYDADVPRNRVNDEGWEYWDCIMATVTPDTAVQDKLNKARGKDTQRTHCAALARFCRVCGYLKLDPHSIDTFEELVCLIVKVLTWAADNGAKIFWLKAIRTALSVLFNYRFDKELSDNAQVKSLMHACELEQLTDKKPLELTWDLSDLLQHICHMPPNRSLSYAKLQRKCIALVMVNTTARFSEIAQFSVSSPESTGKVREWRFTVRVKGKAYVQPIVLHEMQDSQLDPLAAMRALRQRMMIKRWINRRKPMGSFWRQENGQTMTPEHLRAQVKQLLAEAGIQESSPYHLKHATMSYLHKQGATADDLRRLARHTHSSNAYTDFYLNEDFGASCSRMIENAITPKKVKVVAAKKAKREKETDVKPRVERRYLRSSRKRS
jgi:site-specific recombinase XerD